MEVTRKEAIQYLRSSTMDNFHSDCQLETVSKHFHRRRKRRTKKLIALKVNSEYFLVYLYVVLQGILLVTLNFSDAKLYPNNINPSSQLSQDFMEEKKIYHPSNNGLTLNDNEYTKGKICYTYLII